MRLLLFLSIIFLVSCNEKEEISKSAEIIEISDKDSTYSLSNGMKIFLNKGTFSDPGIIMECIIIKDLEDFIQNRLLTMTDKGEHLLTLGMTKITFKNSDGNIVKPLKEFTLLSKPHSRDDLKTFTGSQDKDGNIVWSEFKTDKFLLDFIPNASGSNGFHDLTISSGGNLCDYLDSTFSKQIFHDSLKGILRLNIVGNFFEYDTLIMQSSEYSRFKMLIEKEMMKIQFNSDSTKFYTNPSRCSIYIESFDASKNRYDFKNRSAIITTRTGWFNFDAYIDGDLSVLEIICKDSSDEFRIISKNLDRSMDEEKLSAKKRKFEVPIIKEHEKMIILKINKGIVIDQKEIDFTANRKTINW
jgi:hypothetical protein